MCLGGHVSGELSSLPWFPSGTFIWNINDQIKGLPSTLVWNINDADPKLLKLIRMLIQFWGIPVLASVIRQLDVCLDIFQEMSRLFPGAVTGHHACGSSGKRQISHKTPNYSAVPLKRGQFSHKYSQKTYHSSPVRYGLSFVDPASDWYSASVPVIIGLRYNGTLLYLARRWTFIQICHPVMFLPNNINIGLLRIYSPSHWCYHSEINNFCVLKTFQALFNILNAEWMNCILNSLKFVSEGQIDSYTILIFANILVSRTTSHYQNSVGLVFWSIYASFGLNELNGYLHSTSPYVMGPNKQSRLFKV